jgi:hypothetical protein
MGVPVRSCRSRGMDMDGYGWIWMDMDGYGWIWMDNGGLHRCM